MGVTLPYIFRVGLALAVCSLLYFLLVKKNASFLFSRYYLLAALGLSFGLPLISFPVYMTVPAMPTAVSPASEWGLIALQGEWVSEERGSGPAVWSLVFWAGVLISWLHTLVSHLRLHYLIKSASKEIRYGQEIWVVRREVPPFSYFHKIVIPARLLDSPHLESVVQHEAIHAGGKHCVDLYVSALVCALQWFNPFSWLVRKAIKDNLEFLTDAQAICHIDAYVYKMGLVAMASRTGLSLFPSISRQTQLKERIMMMQNTKTNKREWKRLWVLIPVLGLVSFSLSGRTVIWTEAGCDFVPEQEIENLVAEPTAWLANEEMQQEEEMQDITGDNLISVLKTNEIATLCEEEIALVKPVLLAEIQPVPSVKNLQRAPVVYAKPILTIQNDSTVKRPLYIVNGVRHDGSPLLPENIENITILKGAAAVAIYGEEARQGVIMITTNKATAAYTMAVKRNSTKEQASPPLFIVDGKKHGGQSINPATVKSLTVLKGNSAVALYGEEARQGVVIVELRKDI
jgi:Antirepressor regulating drug resistance, predicted signal transduction N-terminal membrane component